MEGIWGREAGPFKGQMFEACTRAVMKNHRRGESSGKNLHGVRQHACSSFWGDRAEGEAGDHL